MTKVILPWANRKDVEQDVSKEVQKDMEFVFVKNLTEALDAAFGIGRLSWRRNANLLESRL
jgi:ATP-dependent Lon protease